MLIITAALSIQDPRERPADAREAADAQHKRFAEPGSDFLTLVTCGGTCTSSSASCRGRRSAGCAAASTCTTCASGSGRTCYGQLRQAARDVGAGADRDGRAGRKPGQEGAGRHGMAGQRAAFPRSWPTACTYRCWPGCCRISACGTQIRSLRRNRRGPVEFAGARGARFAVFPDSVLARKPPSWVVAAELVETSRLWARTTARIEPEWAETLAAHLVKRTYSEPHWDAGRGAAMALERVTLYGLPIVTARPVNYARVDPAAARDLFITGALVEGDWATRHEFFRRNQRLLHEAGDLEGRARRRGIVADDAARFGFFDQRIPKDVTSARHFDAWWKTARAQAPDLLTFTLADLVDPAAGGGQVRRLPRHVGRAAAVVRVRARGGG